MTGIEWAVLLAYKSVFVTVTCLGFLMVALLDPEMAQTMVLILVEEKVAYKVSLWESKREMCTVAKLGGILVAWLGRRKDVSKVGKMAVLWAVLKDDAEVALMADATVNG